MSLCKDCNCPAIPGERYCKMHLKHADQRRPVFHAPVQPSIPFAEAQRPNERLYRSTRWTTLSRKVREATPYCANCGARAGLTVHHIVPPKGNAELFYDESNLVVVCKPCHDSITAREGR